MSTTATPDPTPHRGSGRPFLPGQSGNPAGRPKGSRNKTTLAAEALLAGKLELAGQVVDTGLKEGKLQAARLVFNAFMGRPRPAAPEFEMPPIDGPDDVYAASAAVLAAASSGGLTPTEAFALHKVVEARAILVGWAPPERDAGSQIPDVAFKSFFDYRATPDSEPVTVGIPMEILHYNEDGTQIRYRRTDTPSQQELAAEAARQERWNGRPTAAQPALAPPAPAAETEAPKMSAKASAKADLSADAPARMRQQGGQLPEEARPASAKEGCIISQDTASSGPQSDRSSAASAQPDTRPKRPALIDAERALAKWQAIFADETLAEHKREVARLEVLRYKASVENLQAPGGPPIIITLREPGETPPPEPEPDWPPPPRTITIDVPLLWTPEAHRKWLADEGLPLHPTDRIVCRRPTKEPEIVSVVPRSLGEGGGRGDGIAQKNRLDLAQGLTGNESAGGSS